MGETKSYYEIRAAVTLFAAVLDATAGFASLADRRLSKKWTQLLSQDEQ